MSRNKDPFLTDQDVELFKAHTDGTKPLKNKPRVHEKPLPPAKKQRPRQQVEEQTPRQLERLNPLYQTDLDRGFSRKIKTGKIEIEATFDMHGMTLLEAEGKLAQFLKKSLDAGLKCVLIITGKGQRTENEDPDARPGVLRRHLPVLIETTPLKAYIISVAPARREHGGSGAFYVRLRLKEKYV